MHIGLIGGIGPAATEFYYRNLARAHHAAGQRMELTIVHAHVGDLLQNMTNQAPDKQAQIFLSLTQRLQAAGADVVAVASLAGHFCINELEKLSPLPIINAIPELTAELTRRKLTRVGLMGTRVVMNSRLYAGISGIDAETHAFVSACTEADLAKVIAYNNFQGERWAYPLWQQMAHQVNHAAQHRGEVAMVLSAWGHSPGALDLLYFVDTQDHPYRTIT